MIPRDDDPGGVEWGEVNPEGPFPAEVEEILIDGIDQARYSFRKLLGFFHPTIFLDNIVLGVSLTSHWYGPREYEAGFDNPFWSQQIEYDERGYQDKGGPECSSHTQPAPTVGGSQTATATPPVARSATSTPMS